LTTHRFLSEAPVLVIHISAVIATDTVVVSSTVVFIRSLDHIAGPGVSYDYKGVRARMIYLLAPWLRAADRVHTFVVFHLDSVCGLGRC
jgi:hypothetical protein